jgi:hypothetical protein
LIAVFRGERAGFQSQNLGHTPAIFQGQVNIAVTSARNATVAAALTLKLNSIFPKLIFRHLTVDAKEGSKESQPKVSPKTQSHSLNTDNLSPGLLLRPGLPRAVRRARGMFEHGKPGRRRRPGEE